MIRKKYFVSFEVNLKKKKSGFVNVMFFFLQLFILYYIIVFCSS